MAQKYAKGSHAWGICGRSGQKMLLKNMVFDGRFPNMRVHPDWWEDKHPQEYMPKVEDPTALYRPSPEVIAAPTAPVLTASQQGIDIGITWTPSETDITEIASYSIFRGIDGAAPTLFLTCNVLRDFLGGITGVQHCTTTPSIPVDDTSDQPQHGDSSGSVFDKVTVEDAPVTYLDTAVIVGHTYCYYIVGNPMGNNQSVAQGPPSAPSNTACVTFFGQATAPVLSGNIVGASEVDLTWTASTITGSTIANYAVWRNVDAGPFSLLTTTAGNVLAFNDLTVTHGHVYQYYVIAHPTQGSDSPQSNTVTEGAQATTPVLAGSQVGADVSLTWSASTVAGSTIANYAITRNVDGGAFSPLTTVAGNVLAYTDPAPTAGHTYGYKVQALATFGIDSAKSNEVDVTVSAVTHTWNRIYTEAGSLTDNAISDFVFFSPTRILAVGDLFTLLLSTDGGVTWNPVTPAEGGDGFLGRSELAYNGSVVVISTTNFATGFNVVSRSTDQGATWTLISPAGMALVGQVVWSPLLNLFVSPDGASAKMWTSPDGLTWTSRALSAIFNPNTASPYKDRIEEFGLFLWAGGGAGHTGQIIRTSDGVTWTITTIANPVFGFGEISFDGTYLIADGQSSTTQWLYRSTDGVSWSLASSSAVAATPPFVPFAFQYGSVLVTGYPTSGGNALGTSTDHGSTFSSIGITTAMDGPNDAFVAAGGTFFATFFGGLGGIASSVDLSTWHDELADGTVNNIITIKTAFGITLAGGEQRTTRTAAIWKRT